MTNEMIATTMNRAKDLSKEYGMAWVLSNGKELKVVRHEVEKEILTDEQRGYGFWVGAIFEEGYRVDL